MPLREPPCGTIIADDRWKEELRQTLHVYSPPPVRDQVYCGLVRSRERNSDLPVAPRLALKEPSSTSDKSSSRAAFMGFFSANFNDVQLREFVRSLFLQWIFVELVANHLRITTNLSTYYRLLPTYDPLPTSFCIIVNVRNAIQEKSVNRKYIFSFDERRNYNNRWNR